MNVLTEPFAALWNSPRDFKVGFASALSAVAFVTLLLFSFFGVDAHATLHSSVPATFTTLMSDFDDLMDLAWPFVGLLLVLCGLWVCLS